MSFLVPDVAIYIVYSDNCNDVTWSQNPAANSMVSNGNYTIKVNATDKGGNR